MQEHIQWLFIISTFDKNICILNQILISECSKNAMAEKDRAMDILSNRHEANLIALHRQYEEELEAMQSKFDAMHFLCLTLAKEIRKNEKLDLLRGATGSSNSSSWPPWPWSRTTGLVYRSTDSTPEVQQEMFLANERAEEAKQERVYISYVHIRPKLLRAEPALLCY